MNKDPMNFGKFAEPAHALLRIATALTFISHGTMKFFGFPALPGGAVMPSPQLFSLMGVAGALELVGGFLVLIGFLTRPVAFLLAGEMAVAFWMMHAPNGVIPLSNMGESAYLFCFIFLWLAAAGAGPWSIDGTSKSE